MEGTNSLKSVQMGLVTFIAQTGVGTVMLPTALAKEVGHDGWISVMVTAGITVILSILIILLLRRYSNKAIYDINQFIFGKILGTGFNIMLLMYLMATTILGASLFNYFIRITLLPKTPPWVLSIFITLPSFYLVWQGLKYMSRFLYISVLNYFFITILIGLLFKDFRLSFLLPVNEVGITRILYSTKTSFFAFIGFELIAFFYPYVSDRDKVLKCHIIASLASMVFFVVTVAASTAVFGENLLSIISMPIFNLSRIYNAPIVERVDLYFIALWFIPMACSMRNYVFAAFDGILKVFKLRKTKFLYIAYFVVVLILSSIPKDIIQVLSLIEIINFAGIGVTVFLILCLPLSFLFKNGVSTK